MVNPTAVNWLDKVKWDANGLVPVIAQEASTNDVLMFAWMNREALAKTVELGRAVYFSPLAPAAVVQGRGVRPRSARA